jgi:hypothetical protein
MGRIDRISIVLRSSGAIALLGAALAGCAEATTAPGQSEAKATPTSAAEQTAAVTGPSAGEVAAGAQATAVAQAAVSRGLASAAALTAYRTRAGIALQSYANALGALRERDREVGERPALIGDASWIGRTRAAMQGMQTSSDRLTEIEIVPPEMALTASLIRQIDGETRLLGREYELGIQGGAPASLATAGKRTTLMLALLGEANRELRRGQGA